jgi:hypothetical protein
MNEPYLYHNIHSARQFGIFNNQLVNHTSHPNSQSMDQSSYSATNIRILIINNLTNVIVAIHYKPTKIHILIITEPENMR